MADCTELEVFFRTTNMHPLQELRGIFNKHWDAVSITQKGGAGWFDVCIHELSLVESLEILRGVKDHCNRNHRDLTLVVTYGVLHDFDGIKLRS